MIQALLLMWGVITWLFLILNWYIAPTWLMLATTAVAAGVFIWEYMKAIRRKSSGRNGRDTVAMSATLFLIDGLLATWTYHAWTLDWFSSLLAAQVVLVAITCFTLYVLFRYRRFMNRRNIVRQSGRKKDSYLKSNKVAQRTPQQRRRQKETEEEGLAFLVIGREIKDE